MTTETNLEKIASSDTIRPSIRASLIVARKNIRVFLRYPWGLIFWMIMPLIWVVPFIFQGQALVGSNMESESFAKMTGSADFIGFILIGTMVWTIADAAIWGAGNALRWERHSGTLEYLWMAPISRTDLLMGSAISESSWAIGNMIVQFIIISFVFNWNFPIVHGLLILIVVGLLLIGLFGIGCALAALVLVFKEPGVLTEFFESALYILSPVRYPQQVFPRFIQIFTWLIPFTWGLVAIRMLVLTSTDYLQFTYLIIGLIIIDAILWVSGYKLFLKAEKRTLMSGSLGEY